MTETNPIPQIYTVSELAAKWGTSDTFIYTMLNSGDLPGFKLGGKLWRIRASDVEAYECRDPAGN